MSRERSAALEQREIKYWMNCKDDPVILITTVQLANGERSRGKGESGTVSKKVRWEGEQELGRTQDKDASTGAQG